MYNDRIVVAVSSMQLTQLRDAVVVLQADKAEIMRNEAGEEFLLRKARVVLSCSTAKKIKEITGGKILIPIVSPDIPNLKCHRPCIIYEVDEVEVMEMPVWQNASSRLHSAITMEKIRLAAQEADLLKPEFIKRRKVTNGKDS